MIKVTVPSVKIKPTPLVHYDFVKASWKCGMLLCAGNAEGRVSFGVECSRGNASTLESVFHRV